MPSDSAVRANQQVADCPSDRMSRILSDRCGDESVSAASREWDLAAPVVEQLPRILPAPVAFDEVAEAEITDPGAPGIDDLRHRPRLRHLAQRPGHGMDSLLQGRTRMRRAKGDQMPDARRPVMPGDRSGLARRTSDEASHRVPDEIQLINRHGPGLEKSIE